MDILVLTTIVSTLANLVLGIFVFVKNKRSRTHQLFSIYCLLVALWAVATYFSLVVTEKEDMLFWMRFVMALATAQSVTILLFVHTFPKHSFCLRKSILSIILIMTLVTFILSFTPYIFSDVELSSAGEAQMPIIAPGIILFIFVTIGAIIFSIILAFKKYVKGSGAIKLQLRYILSGLILMYAGIIYFSFINVVALQNSNYVYLGSLFTLPFIFFTAYTILRYRFMDIRVVIRKGLIYGISLIAALAVYTYVALTLKSTIEESWDVHPTWTASILIALVALGFPPLKKLVEKSINTLFKGRKSIDLAVKEVREKVVHETDFEKLVRLVSEEVKKFLEVDEVRLYLLNHQEKKYIYENDGAKESIEIGNDLVHYFEKYSDALVRDEVPHLMEEKEGKFEKERLQKVEKELKKRKMSLVLPLKTEEEVFGLLMLGEREKGQAYTIQDVKYLESLREQVGFTLANALLYKEAMARITANAV
jgi:hypothetical protein